MFEGIFTGLSTALMPFNLMMVVVGCFAGTFIGMLPGLGPISAVALMIPITYTLDPSSGIILMACFGPFCAYFLVAINPSTGRLYCASTIDILVGAGHV